MKFKFDEKIQRKILIGIMIIILIIIFYISFINYSNTYENTIFYVFCVVFCIIILLYLGKDKRPEEKLFLYFIVLLLIYHILSSLYNNCYRFTHILNYQYTFSLKKFLLQILPFLKL
jgi:uncharacterized membrane protein